MTEQQYNDAQDVIYKIKDVTNAIDKFDDLVERVERITGKYQRGIKIQIAEQYMSTPVAEVNLKNFLEFIATEKALLEMQKQELEKKFENI